jgi:acetate kinase
MEIMATSIVLALNTGSSSLKFACYRCTNESEKLLYQGAVTRIGLASGKFSAVDGENNVIAQETGSYPSMNEACEKMFSWIDSQSVDHRPSIIGHRIVHGGPNYSHPQQITDSVMAELEDIKVYAPEHIPPALKTINYAFRAYPSFPHIACFDTAFHRTMYEAAQTYPLPPEYRHHGLQKYGFHGLSYEYLLGVLRSEDETRANSSRILFAHLGHGASMAAVKDGRCVDTTMGFSPAGGFPMSTRSGDLDPEVVLFLMQHEHIPVEDMKDVFNKKSGVLAISERSDDFKDLLTFEESDPKCHFAIEYFCYHVRKHIGALVSAMNGLDTIVFSAGIGEKSSELRKRICLGLEYLGVEVDDERNTRHNTVISSDRSRVIVRVINTNEEVIIARQSRLVVLNN